jgi:hypothetical protein
MNPDDNDLTIIGQLISKYSNKASPLTSTIFGYFIEYKFHEMLSNKYGGHKVEHSVKLKGLNSSDIDILVTPQPNEYIAIEIKPGNVLQDELSMEKIGKNMCLRTKGLIDERTGKILEIWLVVYSLGLNKEQDLGKYLLNEEEKNNICSLEKIIKDCHEFPVLLRVKHYIIKSNRLREDRHIYQNFMRNPINIEEINDLFPFDLDN